MNRLNIAYTNIDTFTWTKYYEIRQYIHIHDIHIMAIADTRKHEPIRIPGFMTYSIPPPGPSGGITILMKQHLQVKCTHVDRNIKTPHAFSLTIKTGPTSSLTIIPIYLHPTTKEFPRKYLQQVFNRNDTVLLLGDMNAKHKDIGNTRNNTRGQQLLDFIKSEQAIILNDQRPTFTCKGLPFSSRLDLMITKKIDRHLFHNYNIHEEIKSDHSSIYIQFDTPALPPHSTPLIIPDYNNANWTQLNDRTNQLLTDESSSLTSNNDIESAATAIIRAVKQATTECIPTKTIHRKNISISHETLNLIHMRKRARQQLKRHPTDTLLKRHINQLNRQIQYGLEHDRYTFFRGKVDQILQEQNPKTFWKLMSLVAGKYSTGNTKIMLKTDTDRFITQDEDVAEAFAQHLHTVSSMPIQPPTTRITDNIIQQFKDYRPDIYDENLVPQDPLDDLQHIYAQLNLHPSPEETSELQKRLLTIPITEFELDYAIQRTRNRAPGPDGLKTIIFQHFDSTLKRKLLNIYNAMVKNGYFPTIWKRATVVMICKPGRDPTDIASYRPISLLDIAGKIFERIISRRLSDHLEQSKFFNDHQGAFRRNRSTISNLIAITDPIMCSRRKKHKGILIGLDADNAFPKMWIDGFLLKITQQQLFPSRITRLLHSFLTNRTFRVKINNHLSQSTTTSAGTPQGSVLSPLLFITYINDLPMCIQNELHRPDFALSQFADDTQIFISDTNARWLKHRTQRILTALQTYHQQWRIKLNHSKTAALLFGFRNLNPMQLQMGDEQLRFTRTHKLLGVTFTSSATFNDHVKIVRQKTLSQMKHLRRLSYLGNAPKQLTLRAYKSLLRPRLEYAAPAWAGNIGKTSWDALEKTQKKAMKIALQTPTWTPTATIYTKIKLQPIRERLTKLSQTYFYKTNRGSGPVHLTSRNFKPTPSILY